MSYWTTCPVIPSVKTVPSWKREQLPIKCAKVPAVTEEGCQPEPERKSLTQEYVNTRYTEDQWTHAYTDGSAAEATRDGGDGVYIRYNENIHSTLKQKLKLSK